MKSEAHPDGERPTGTTPSQVLAASSRAVEVVPIIDQPTYVGQRRVDVQPVCRKGTLVAGTQSLRRKAFDADRPSCQFWPEGRRDVRQQRGRRTT